MYKKNLIKYLVVLIIVCYIPTTLLYKKFKQTGHIGVGDVFSAIVPLSLPIAIFIGVIIYANCKQKRKKNDFQ